MSKKWSPHAVGMVRADSVSTKNFQKLSPRPASKPSSEGTQGQPPAMNSAAAKPVQDGQLKK